MTSGGGRRKTVKRTKGGLLPWWVRKRLQEHSEPGQKGSSDVNRKPVKAQKKALNILEVGVNASPYLPIHVTTQMLYVSRCHLGTDCAEG